jgi:hypothetical protein
MLSSFQQLELSTLAFPCLLGPPQRQSTFLLPQRIKLPPTKVPSLTITTLELLVHKSVQVLQHVALGITASVGAFGISTLAHATRVELLVVFRERGGDAEGLVAAGLGEFGRCTLSLHFLSDLFCELGLPSDLEL